MELFRENLASNEDLLKKTWQQDEEEKRRLDILMISSSYLIKLDHYQL